MPSAQRAVTINRPIEEVFVFVANGESGPKWRSAHIEIRRESGEGVGAISGRPFPARVAAESRPTDAEMAALDTLKRVLEGI